MALRVGTSLPCASPGFGPLPTGGGPFLVLASLWPLCHRPDFLLFLEVVTCLRHAFSWPGFLSAENPCGGSEAEGDHGRVSRAMAAGLESRLSALRLGLLPSAGW